MRLLKSLAVAAILTALSAPPVVAWAATQQPFTQVAFAAAQQDGEPILVEIDASWCPTCAQQRPILSRLMTDPHFAAMKIYKVDFDTQKDVVRAMGARLQSTLIVFHGAVEKGRSTGATDPAAIRDLLALANE